MADVTVDQVLRIVALYMKDLKSDPRTYDNFITNMVDELGLDVDSDRDVEMVIDTLEDALNSLL